MNRLVMIKKFKMLNDYSNDIDRTAPNGMGNLGYQSNVIGLYSDGCVGWASKSIFGFENGSSVFHMICHLRYLWPLYIR